MKQTQRKNIKRFLPDKKQLQERKLRRKATSSTRQKHKKEKIK